jgi:ABC-type nitrate/sulfonate/bicarbonate transport system ATPase subunit
VASFQLPACEAEDLRGMDRQERSRATPPWAGDLLLHAAAVVAPAGALLLLGHSGAGKSTVCRLVAGRLPVLADDVVRLARKGEMGATWHVSDAQQDPAAPVRAVPLVAVLRLFQAEAAALVRATPRQMCGYLADALFEVELQRQVSNWPRRAWFACVADVARLHPGWQLRFTKGPETARLLCEQPWS